MEENDRKSAAILQAADAELVGLEYIESNISTAEDFQSVLRTLVLAADAKGIDVRSCWPVISEVEGTGSWDVEIAEVVRDH
jgi:hypothetical protein